MTSGLREWGCISPLGLPSRNTTDKGRGLKEQIYFLAVLESGSLRQGCHRIGFPWAHSCLSLCPGMAFFPFCLSIPNVSA